VPGLLDGALAGHQFVDHVEAQYIGGLRVTAGGDLAAGAVHHGQSGQRLAGGRGHDRGGVGVLMGVDTDDDLHKLCQHVHCVVLLARKLT
jgi:hypothetical protein